MVDRESLLRKKHKSHQFLQLAYWRTKGWTEETLVFRDFLAPLDLSQDECFEIEDYLSARGWIKRWTMGGLDGSFEITTTGVDQVESAILNGEYYLGDLRSTEEWEHDANPSLQEMQSWIRDEQKKRNEFLSLLYAKVIDDPSNSSVLRPIAQELNLSDNEAFRIEDYLAGRNLVERITAGGLDGWIAIPDAVIAQIENALLEEGEDTAEPKGIVDIVFDAESDTYPEWFPNKAETRERWAKAWSIMKSQEEEYYDDDAYFDDKPEPSTKEYRDRLSAEMQWKPSPRTIRDIRRAGKAGMLDKFLPP